MSVLVTGFGAFPGVAVNPTEALARAVDGALVAGVPVVGRVLETSFERGPQAAIDAAHAHGARLVLGLGVAVSRDDVCVERTAVRVETSRPDVDGHIQTGLSGPPTVCATVDCAALAEVLGARVSDDAGTYVCNAWLYQVVSALSVPVVFVHVPRSGLSAERLLRGIAHLLG